MGSIFWALGDICTEAGSIYLDKSLSAYAVSKGLYTVITNLPITFGLTEQDLIVSASRVLDQFMPLQNKGRDGRLH